MAQTLRQILQSSTLRSGPITMSNPNSRRTIRALERLPGTEYDEETFLYFLTMERARAGRSRQRLRLLLVTLEPVPGKAVPIVPVSAAKLFLTLRLLLRDTDIIGWYRQDQVAGAILSARADTPEEETSSLIEQRVREGLLKRLPSSVARSLRVRITQQGPRRVVKG
jgi:hypothetical protein